MKTKYKWIENDQQYFGQPNGVYDFSKNDPKEAGQKVKRLNEMKDKMGKQLNSKAMDMLSTQEDRVIKTFSVYNVGVINMLAYIFWLMIDF